MLRLLRGLKKNLFDKGQLRKYLFYAVGEILLVMIGILLALQVNNWNEHRKKQALITSQLINLASSLRSDSMMWSRAIDVNEFRSSSFQYLLEKSGLPFNRLPELPKADSTFIWQGPYPDSLNNEFIRKSYSWFTRGFDNIVIDRTAMNEINNLGLYSEIQNDSLKGKIHDYYMFIDFQFSETNIQTRINREIEFHDYLRDNFGVRSTFFEWENRQIEDPLAFIRNDQGVIFRLKEVMQTANWHCLQAVKAREMSHEIIALIESEVKK